MKITITEIEASAEELKVSNSLADGLSNTLRRIFWNVGSYAPAASENDKEEDEE